MKVQYKEIARSVPNSDCSSKSIGISKDTPLPQWATGQHMLLFVLEGGMKMTIEETVREIPERHFVMVPKQQQWKGVATMDSRLMALMFNMVDNVWTKSKIKTLLDALEHTHREPFPLLGFRAPLASFLELMTIYTESPEADRSFYACKESELLSILYTFYPAQELAPVFGPLLTSNLDFRNFVQANYLKVESVAELARLAGCSQVTLNRKFKTYFNESAYQWILRNKMVLIQKRLQNPTASLADIAKEFGFYSGSELNRFCQRYFGTTALKIRKQIMEKENTK